VRNSARGKRYATKAAKVRRVEKIEKQQENTVSREKERYSEEVQKNKQWLGKAGVTFMLLGSELI
jgi:RPA family protein